MGLRSAALGAVLLAFVLRVTNLGNQSLWYDEAFGLLLASRSLGEILEGTSKDIMPPLYYWLLHLWGTGPPVDFYPRFLSVVAGTLSVACVYGIARPLVGQTAAVGAALFTAVSPFHLFYSQELRMYAVLGLWNLVAAWGFVQGWFEGRGWGWAVYSAGLVLALYTHSLGWLPAVALVGWAVLNRRGWRSLLPILAAVAAAALLYLPWAGVLARQVATVFNVFWADQPGPLNVIASFYLLYQGPFAGSLYPIALSGVLLALGLTLPVMVARRAEAGPLSLLWCWALLPLLLLFALSLVRPVYLERVVTGAAFPVYILLGYVLGQGRPSPAGLALGLVVLGAGVWGIRNWYVDPAFGKPPYREVAALARSNWAPLVPVLHTSDGSYLPFLLYAQDLPSRFLAGDPEGQAGMARAHAYNALGLQPLSVLAAVGDATRFLLVVALDHSVEHQRALAEEIDRRYRRVSEESVGGVIVRGYER